MPSSPQSSLFTVDLEPTGRRARVPAGATLLDAARAAGVDIVASCGGVGICGTCVVKIVRGEVSALNQQEREVLSPEEVRQGLRLACQTQVLGDVGVDIPPASLVRGQRLQLEGQSTDFPFQPAAQIVDIACAPPDLRDLRADMTRVNDALGAAGKPPLAASVEQMDELSARLRREGWRARLVCFPDGRLAASLRSGSPVLGVAMDLGTTKLALYLLDLTTGGTLAAAGVVNPQIAYGEDVISRISYANRGREQRRQLQTMLVNTINQTVQAECARLGLDPSQVVEYAAAGNTAIHHLFCGLEVEQLGRAPYVALVDQALSLQAAELGLAGAPGARVYLPPNIAGYVGADHVAALTASQERLQESPALLVDIGTNTEISLQVDGRWFSCSCASGPAFEGAHIHDGMRAAPGAIEKVEFSESGLRLHTIGDLPPVGICGSGVLHAVAQLLEHQRVDRRGVFTPRLPGGFQLVSADQSGHGREIVITRKDIHEIQLAKAAIRAGIQTLCRRAGIQETDIRSFVIAGAFGTHLDLASAIKVGMFPPLPASVFHQVGNAAGVGARMMLASISARQAAERLARLSEYIELTIAPEFTGYYENAIYFPER